MTHVRRQTRRALGCRRARARHTRRVTLSAQAGCCIPILAAVAWQALPDIGVGGEPQRASGRALARLRQQQQRRPALCASGGRCGDGARQRHDGGGCAAVAAVDAAVRARDGIAGGAACRRELAARALAVAVAAHAVARAGRRLHLDAADDRLAGSNSDGGVGCLGW